MDVAGQPHLKTAVSQDLEKQVRRVKILLFVLVSLIVVAPVSAFAVLELNRMHATARQYARESAMLVQLPSDSELSEAVAHLETMMKVDDTLAFVSLRIAEGTIFRLGQPSQALFSARATMPFTLWKDSTAEMEVEVEFPSLGIRIARVLGIHVLVAMVVGLFILRMPIRTLDQAVKKLDATQAQLIHSERLSTLGEMYSGLAHEINNPLSVILSRVQLMRNPSSKLPSPKGLEHDLALIERHGSRIAETVRSLLAFARKTPFQKVETDLNQIVEDVLSLVEKPFAKNGIHIERYLDRGLPPLIASPTHLQQVLLNLFSNARDAMPNGGTIEIHTSRNSGNAVQAVVKDTGTGIASDVIDKVFEPFFTTKAEGKGTGLGLSVSYGIVKAHGGDVEVESAPGQGTVFRITLPVTATEP